MTRPIIKEVNLETQESFEREMNDEEYAKYLILEKESNERMQEIEARNEAEKAKKLKVKSKLEELGFDLDTIRAMVSAAE